MRHKTGCDSLLLQSLVTQSLDFLVDRDVTISLVVGMKFLRTLLIGLFIAYSTYGVFAAEINVLRLKGHNSSSFYTLLESNASTLGSDTINFTGYSGSVTLNILNQYSPDVLIISNPSGGNEWYTSEERDAIIAYLSQENKGEGILGEGYVFNSIGDTRPKLHFMAPIFGFRDGIIFDNVAQSGCLT